jgi:uncharacterized protein (UPF0332 family)
MDENLTAAQIRLDQAREAMRAAELLADNGLTRSSIERNYYAAFHAGSPLLASRGIYPSTHDGTISMLALHFVKAGTLPKSAGRDLQRLQDQRLVADDKGYLDQDAADAAECLALARAFLNTISPLLPGNVSSPDGEPGSQ